MDTSALTGGYRPENTAYDRARHAKMKLRPIGYGYFHINRSEIETPKCEGCGAEVENPVRFHNRRPYHVECYRLI
jgi:hypothetical protein